MVCAVLAVSVQGAGITGLTRECSQMTISPVLIDVMRWYHVTAVQLGHLF